MIAGVLTANELTLLRTRPQRTQLYLAIPEYTAVYTALVDGTPVSNDNAVTIPFKNGVGLLTDVHLDMMMLVSNTGYGEFDAGMARIRKDGQLGDTSFSIGITSEIEWTDNQFITIINDYSLWPRHPYINPATEIVYMDYDVAYSAQNSYGAPVPIIGTHAVLELTGAAVTTNFDASDSYACIGTPVSYDYVWTCAGAVVATPNAVSTDITFNAVGTYLVELEITADFGGSVSTPITAYSLARRYVIVHDADNPLNTAFVLDSCSGDYDSGNWSYRITMNADAEQTDIRDRTLCLLVAKDWYGTTEQSIGPLEGRENIVCVGWIDGDSITRSNDKSMVSFEVQGPAFWLGVQEGFPTGVDDTNAAPTDWVHIEGLTPRRGLYHFLRERTTAISLMDCWITTDDHRIASTYTPAGSLLEQLNSICQKVNAKPVCDRYGRLFCGVDTQFIDPALRVFPVVQTLTDRDWRDEIRIERKEVSQVGSVDLSGVYYSGDFATSTALFALAPGHYPRHYGFTRKIERIALDDQAEANTQAGFWLSYLNNEYPNIDVLMSSNYRAVDIAPRMFVQMSLAAGDTPRGIEWTNKKLIPRRVDFNYDGGEAVLLTDISFEAETFASDAVTGDPPIEPPDPPDPPPPPTPPTPVPPAEFDFVVVMTESKLAYSFNAISDPAGANWTDITPAGLTGNMMSMVVSEAGEVWLAIKSVMGDAWEGIWYTADLTTAPLTRILSTDTCRNDLGLAGDAGVYFDIHSLCIVGTECFGAVKKGYTANTTFHYWHGNGAMAHGTCVTGAHINTAIYGTSCMDGASANYGLNSFGYGGWTFKLASCSDVLVTLVGGNMSIVSENYSLQDGTAIKSLAGGAIVYTGAYYLRQLLEFDGHLYWTRAADYALMQDGIVQALANDAGGVNGVFSTGGAVGGGYAGVQTTATLIWIAHTPDATNTRRNMALTQDGGFTWVSIDGDWNAAVGVWDGGAGAIGPIVRYAHVTFT